VQRAMVSIPLAGVLAVAGRLLAVGAGVDERYVAVR